MSQSQGYGTYLCTTLPVPQQEALEVLIPLIQRRMLLNGKGSVWWTGSMKSHFQILLVCALNKTEGINMTRLKEYTDGNVWKVYSTNGFKGSLGLSFACSSMDKQRHSEYPVEDRSGVTVENNQLG